jgi:hypothetical protein
MNKPAKAKITDTKLIIKNPNEETLLIIATLNAEEQIYLRKKCYLNTGCYHLEFD